MAKNLAPAEFDLSFLEPDDSRAQALAREVGACVSSLPTHATGARTGSLPDI